MMRRLDLIALITLMIAAICWGLFAFDFDLIGYVINIRWFATLIYVIMGAAGVYVIIRWRSIYKGRKKESK